MNAVTAVNTQPSRQPELVSVVAGLMGGQVGVHIQPSRSRAGATIAAREAGRALRRIEAWANRLTRYSPTSELSRLNDDPRSEVPIRPTLAAVLDWARSAEGLTNGIVDIALLDARLTAEGCPDSEVRGGSSSSHSSRSSRSWSVDRRPLGGVVRRPPGLRFDLDGVAKGWLADRALDLLDGQAAAVVDGDGDVAIRLRSGERVRVGVADPRRSGFDLAILELTGPDGPGERRFGLATSGTSVHRWVRAGQVAHHLIDPRTGWSATTDVVQATVLARTAREAEALAKTAVILGASAALEMLDRPDVHGGILLTDRHELFILPSTRRWLV
jgi:thiamine biosynthesis lipoprotein